MASNKARHKKFTVTEKFIHSSLCFAFSMSHLCRHKRGNCLGPCGCAVVLLSPDPVPTSAKARKVSEPRTLIYPSSYSSSSKWSALLPPADESLAVLVDCAVAAGRTLRRRTGNRPPVATPRRGGGDHSLLIRGREASLNGPSPLTIPSTRATVARTETAVTGAAEACWVELRMEPEENQGQPSRRWRSFREGTIGESLLVYRIAIMIDRSSDRRS